MQKILQDITGCHFTKNLMFGSQIDSLAVAWVGPWCYIPIHRNVRKILSLIATSFLHNCSNNCKGVYVDVNACMTLLKFMQFLCPEVNLLLRE